MRAFLVVQPPATDKGFTPLELIVGPGASTRQNVAD